MNKDSAKKRLKTLENARKLIQDVVSRWPNYKEECLIMAGISDLEKKLRIMAVEEMMVEKHGKSKY